MQVRASKEAFDKCPACGGRLAHKDVETILRGGNNAAIIKLPADACERCHTALYSVQTMNWIHNICKNLEEGETSRFKLLGRFFEVPPPSGVNI